MTELPYRPEHVNDAIAASDDLTNEELGAYIRLQRALWRAGGLLPENDLQRISRAGKRWNAIAPAIMRRLKIASGMASCPDIMAMLVVTRERRAKAVERGERAARSRWGGNAEGANALKNNKAAMLGASSEHCLSDANQNQNPIDKNLSSVGSGNAVKIGNILYATIYEEGVQLLVGRAGMRLLAARAQISRWLADAGDAERVANLLAAVSVENLRGDKLIAVLHARVAAYKKERKNGPSLPFPFSPNVIDGSSAQ